MDLSKKITPIDLTTYTKRAHPEIQNNKQADQNPKQTIQLYPETDRVILTSNVITFRNAAQLARQIPEIREDLVARIRDQIENGTYRVDAEKAAATLLDESLTNTAHLETT
jgi:flagellar biosynthesis anti-sigma factor FlgM